MGQFRPGWTGPTFLIGRFLANACANEEDATTCLKCCAERERDFYHGARLLLLEPVSAEFERPAVFRNRAHNLVRRTGRDLRFDLKRHLHRRSHKADQVCDDLISNARRVAADARWVERNAAMEAPRPRLGQSWWQRRWLGTQSGRSGSRAWPQRRWCFRFLLPSCDLRAHEQSRIALRDGRCCPHLSPR